MASDRERRSILATIMGVESGGRNIPQGIVDINTTRGTPAQGYFQIIDPTWARYGGDTTGFKSAISAPYEVQRQIALNIPVDQWGPATQAALKAAGYEPQSGETLGQLLQRHGEDPNATSPSDAGTGVMDPVVAAKGATSTPPSWQGADTAGLLAKQQADKAEKEKEDAATSLTKEGMGLLGKATPPVQDFSFAPMPTRAPQQQPFRWLTAMPDFFGQQ